LVLPAPPLVYRPLIKLSSVVQLDCAICPVGTLANTRGFRYPLSCLPRDPAQRRNGDDLKFLASVLNNVFQKHAKEFHKLLGLQIE